MHRQARRPLAPVALAVLLLFGIVTSTQAGTVTENDPSLGLRRYRENFNGIVTGATPSDSWYTVTTNGTGNQFVNSAKAWQVTDSSAPFAAQLRNTGDGVDFCSGTQSVTFVGSVPDLASTTTVEYRLSASAVTSGPAPANTVFVRFTGIVASTVQLVNFGIRGNTGAENVASTTGQLTAGASFNLTASQGNCANTASATWTINSGITGAGGSVTVIEDAGVPIVGDLDRLTVANPTGAVGTTVTIDDYDWQGAPTPAPTVTSVSPAGGSTSGGTTVTITGTGFQAGASVTFGGTAATGVVVGSATSITATTPARPVGAVSVVVTNTDGRSGTCASCYTYQSAPTPFITALSPSSGTVNGGNVVNITGGNFQTGATVKFDASFASASVVNQGLIQATTPPHAAGSVTVNVTNQDGQTVLCASCFTYSATTGGGGSGGGGSGNQTGTTTTINPSAFANSGFAPDIDINGNVTAIVHRNSGNALVLTYSTDGGATWTDRAVGATAAYTVARVFAFNSTAFGVMFNFGAASPTYRLTTDGGSTWAHIQLPTTQTCGVGVGCATGTPNRYFDAVYDSGRLYATYSLGMQGLGCGGAAVNECQSSYVYRSDDFGLTWATGVRYTNYFQDVGATLLDYVFAMVKGATDNTQVQILQGPSSIGRYFITNNGGTIASADTVQDALNPLTDYGYGLRAERENGDAIAFRRASGNQAFLGIKQPGGTYFFYSYGPSPQHAVFTDAYATPTAGSGAVSMETSGGEFKLYSTRDNAASYQTTTIESIVSDNDPAVATDCNNIWAAYHSNETGRLRIARLNDATPCAAEVDTTPEASVVVPGLVDWKIDVTGQNVLIARYDDATNTPNDGGNEVSTYEPGSLAIKATTETACAALSGIDALPTHVAFTGCDVSNPTDTDQVYIRNPFLESPELNGCSWCRGSIDEGDANINLPNNIDRLQSISQYPYTFEGLTRVNNAPNYVVVAFPFTELGTGVFGIYAVKFFNNGLDSDSTERVQFSATGTTIDGLCSWRGNSGTDYIAVSDPSVGVRVYTFTIDHDESLDDNDITITQYLPSPNDLRQAEGLACRGNLVMVSTFDGKVGAFYVEGDTAGHTAGQTAWLKTGIETIPGGVAISVDESRSQQFGSYYDGGEVVFVSHGNATVPAGTETGRLTLPAGQLRGMAMDRAANNLWVGVVPSGGNQNATIYRFSAVGQTDGDGTLDTNPDPFTNTSECDPNENECPGFCEANPTAETCVEFCTANPSDDSCENVCEENPDIPGCSDQGGGFIGGGGGIGDGCLLCGDDPESRSTSARVFRGGGFTLLTLVGMAVTLGAMPMASKRDFSGKLALAGAILGFVVGIVLSWAFGWFPLWLLILTLLVSMGLGVLAVWLMRR